MFESIMKFFNKLRKKEEKAATNSKEAAKERLHLVLMQDRANVSADFLEMMKQEIIDVIKKYIDIDEGAIDVRLTNKENEDGTNGAPALYANIPILNIKNEARKIEKTENKKEEMNNNPKDANPEEEKKENKEQELKNEEKKMDPIRQNALKSEDNINKENLEYKDKKKEEEENENKDMNIQQENEEKIESEDKEQLAEKDKETNVQKES